jgi:hypothetical protein
MASELEGIVCADREPGAGAPDGSGHAVEDEFGLFKGLLWAVPLSAWCWWVLWLAWRAL